MVISEIPIILDLEIVILATIRDLITKIIQDLIINQETLTINQE